MPITSVFKDHSHSYHDGDDFTSVDENHMHPLSYLGRNTGDSSGHKHVLPMR